MPENGGGAGSLGLSHGGISVDSGDSFGLEFWGTCSSDKLIFCSENGGNGGIGGIGGRESLRSSPCASLPSFPLSGLLGGIGGGGIFSIL